LRRCSGASDPWCNAIGRFSLLIAHSDRGEFRTTGFAVFRVPRGQIFNAPHQLATQLSRYWFDLGDVTCLGTDTAWARSRSTID